MNNIKKLNVKKKLWSTFFTICMLITSLSYLPMDKVFATMIHDVKITGCNKLENEEFVYSVEGIKLGTLKIEGNSSNPQANGYTSLENGNYKIIVGVENGYHLDSLKINDKNYTVNELKVLNSNTYSYDFNLNSTIKNMDISAEFKSNVSPYSQRKIYVGDTLCIDESQETPITHYSNSDFDIFPGESLESYVISLKQNASLPSIVADKNTDIIIKTHGAANIDANNGFSIQGVRNLTVFDENASENILKLNGAIDVSDSIILNKNVQINSNDKGIISSNNSSENKPTISVDHSKLVINSSSSALENIKGDISIGSSSKLEVFSHDQPFKNIGKILLKDGGECNINSSSSILGSKVYSAWANLNDNTLLNSNTPYTQKEINWSETSEEIKTQNNYSCSKSEISEQNKYYVWNAKSLSPTLSTFVYGKNMAGETLKVIGGDIEILSATGINQNDMSDTKYGNYKFKSGTEILLKLTPKCGYQLNSNILKDAVAQEEKCVYKFIMPDNNICLDDVFLKSAHNVLINSSSSIKSANIDIPEGDISGTAVLKISALDNVSNEDKFKDKANDFNISEYLDFSLEEVIFKNGDPNKEAWRTPITQLNSPVDITLELGDNLKGKKRCCILRDHEGQIDNLSSIYTPKNSVLKFSTDKFSQYALGESDTVRTLKSTVKYKDKDLNIIIEDTNNSLSDGAELEVTLVEENSERYKILQNQLDDTHKVENIIFFDIVIYKDSSHTEKYSQLTAPVNVFFEIPEGWDKEDLQAVLVASGVDGEFEEQIVKKDDKEYLSFSTDHFSPYAFLDELSEEELKNLNLDDLDFSDDDDDDTTTPTETEDVSTDNQDDTNVFNMVTGDRSRNIIIYSAVAIVISIIAILFLKKKKTS